MAVTEVTSSVSLSYLDSKQVLALPCWHGSLGICLRLLMTAHPLVTWALCQTGKSLIYVSRVECLVTSLVH